MPEASFTSQDFSMAHSWRIMLVLQSASPLLPSFCRSTRQAKARRCYLPPWMRDFGPSQYSALRYYYYYFNQG